MEPDGLREEAPPQSLSFCNALSLRWSCINAIYQHMSRACNVIRDGRVIHLILLACIIVAELHGSIKQSRC